MSRLVLVTGGAGFIGSHLVDALLARGDRVRVLDDFSTGRRENLAHCLADIELLEGDVRDPGLVARAVAGCDGVLHEAAVASVTRSLEDPEGTASVTHGGTVTVADLARRAGAGGFVLASSCAVYGDTTALPLSEDSPPRPLSPYALAKLLAEGVCGPRPLRPAEGLSGRLSVPRVVDGGRQQAAADEGSPEMRAVSLRYFNAYGPRQDPSSEYSGVIARFMSVAAARAFARSRGSGGEQTAAPAGPPYVVHGDGRQSRDFVFVSDVVAANLLALDASLAGRPTTSAAVDGAVVNVGTGVRVDLLEIVRLAEGLSVGGEAGGGGPDAAIDFRAPREGDITASQADITRARRLLGYEPAVSFADGLGETYSWYVARGVS